MAMTSMASVSPPASSPFIERWLEEMGISEWRLEPRFVLGKIDEAASLKNQVRYDAFKLEHCFSIAETMTERPDEIPPIIVYLPTTRKKALVVNGIHTWQAAKQFATIATWPAYVITQELGEMQLDRALATGNRSNGRALEPEERLSHAVRFVEVHGWTQTAAAKEMEIELTKLKTRLGLLRSRRRFETLGLKTEARAIAPWPLSRLDDIRSDPVATEAVKLVAEAKLMTEEVNVLVTAINRARSEEAQMAVILAAREEFRPQAEVTTQRVGLPTPIRDLKALLTRAERFDLEALQATPNSRMKPMVPDLKDRLAEAAQKLLQIRDIL